MKTCSKCKSEKELSAFYFRKDTGKHRGQCITCYQSVCSAWVDANYSRVRQAQATHFQENKDAIMARRKHRRNTVPQVNIVHKLRSRMNMALDGKIKQSTSMKLLGCTAEQWRKHLESQFTEGMAWGQRGEWAIDHILPCAAFDLTKKKHQKYCFHWSNTQPMLTGDNLAKSDKYCPDELEAYLKSDLPEAI